MRTAFTCGADDHDGLNSTRAAVYQPVHQAVYRARRARIGPRYTVDRQTWRRDSSRPDLVFAWYAPWDSNPEPAD